MTPYVGMPVTVVDARGVNHAGVIETMFDAFMTVRVKTRHAYHMVGGDLREVSDYDWTFLRDETSANGLTLIFEPFSDKEGGEPSVRERIVQLIDNDLGRLAGPPSYADACRVADVILALRHPPAGEGEGWRTIESAPKDGTSILAICGSAYSPVAGVTWWQEGWTHYSRPAEKWHGGVGKWFPTHWTPLPSPPSTNEGAG